VKVEVFYVPDCPNHPRAVEELRNVLLAEGIATEIHEVAVRNSSVARELKFRGSPTIRINGRDIAGESQELELNALACRIYPGAKEAGVPPVEMIRRAVREAREGEKSVRQRSVISASLGAILSSLATMGCCLPLGFAAAMGTAGASIFFQTLRPWLLGLSIALLGVGFWQQRGAKQCAAKRSYLSAILLWSSLALVIAMILFPQEIAGFIADRFAGYPK